MDWNGFQALRRRAICNVCLAALALAGGCGSPTGAADAPASPKRGPAPATPKKGEPSPAPRDAKKRMVSLDDALALAASALESLDKIQDYTCIFVKRERVGGELLPEERLKMKVRHQPFSVYMRFLEPESLAGQEAIYVEGANDNKLVGHTTGVSGKLVGTIPLDPAGYLAMRNNRYPITNAGMKKLVRLLLELGEKKELLKDCRVSLIEGDEVDGRPCLRVEIENGRTHGEFKLAAARIWLDEEWNVPVRFESWEWPGEAGAKPVLAERYAYLKLRLNQGLTARDFDPKNPDYEFP